MLAPPRFQHVSLVIVIFVALLSPRGGFGVSEPSQRAVLSFFWGKGCPVCARAKPFVEGIKVRYPTLEVKSYEVEEHKENFDLLVAMSRSHGQELQGVPTFFVGGSMFVGFSPEIGEEIEKLVRSCVERGCPEKETPSGTENFTGRGGGIDLPLFGRIETSSLSLPAFTLLIAALDGFNPCSFFVLFFLLSLLIHAHSRFRLVLIGATFVICSGLVYFLYMAVWLNFFTYVGRSSAISIGAAVIALSIAAINIKDFFFFHRGLTLSIPDAVKPRLLERMRGLVQASSLPAMVACTVLLALAANSYGLLCTVGFPMVFIRVLTLHDLPTTTAILYVVLYNLIHIVPLAMLVTVFAITLRSRKLSEREGRVLKLLSGVMMLFLGLVLLVSPSLLNSAAASLALFLATIGTTGIVVVAERRLGTAGGER